MILITLLKLNNIVITIEFKLPDLWIGCFYKNSESTLDIWVCIIPCFPIHYHQIKS